MTDEPGTIGVATNAAFGGYDLSIQATSSSSNIMKAAALHLTIKPFTLSLSEGGVFLMGGDNESDSADITVTINRSPGFTGVVALSSEGLPTGGPHGGKMFASLNPTSTAGNDSVLHVSAERFAPESSFVLTIRGTSGNSVDTVQLGVEVFPSEVITPPSPVEP